MIFPCENENVTPVDFIPKMSSVACVLQCGGIWIGGKGWGLTWKLIQCVVKPREVVSVYGKCQISLSAEDIDTLETQDNKEDIADEDETQPAATSTVVEDSDEEVEIEKLPAPVVVAPVKKVIKKAVVPVTTDAEVVESPEEEVAATTEVAAVDTAAVVKKKIIKKK